MRTVLRLLGTRYGIALILVLFVLAVVGVARTFVNDSTSPVDGTLGPTVAPASTQADPESSLGDDSVVEPSAPSSSLSAGTPDPKTVATRFVTAWLRRPGITAEQWRTGLKVHASAPLMEQLKDSDPTDVPATTIVGPAQIDVFGGEAEAKVPADGGTVRLELAVINGRWQVTALDWEEA